MDVIKLNCINCGAPVQSEKIHRGGTYQCLFCGSSQMFVDYQKPDEIQMLNEDYQVQTYVLGLEEELPLAPPVLTGQLQLWLFVWICTVLLILAIFYPLIGTGVLELSGMAIGAFVATKVILKRRKLFQEKYKN